MKRLKLTNNKIGYIISNCVSCCNFIKNRMDEKDFLNHVKVIYNFINK